jgi:hypothetical protein
VKEFDVKAGSTGAACRIAYAYDLIPQVPCAPRMMACAGNMFETTKRGISSWNYAKVCSRQSELAAINVTLRYKLHSTLVGTPIRSHREALKGM